MAKFTQLSSELCTKQSCNLSFLIADLRLSKRTKKAANKEGGEEIKKRLCAPMSTEAITISVSSRALFNTETERQIYEEKGLEEYVKYHIEHEDTPFAPGMAFSFVKALVTVNLQLRELYPDSQELFDVVIMTSNHPQVGIRLINSINQYDLNIDRFCMTGSESAVGFMKACKTNLYLSKDPDKVKEAIEEGIAAATMYTCEKVNALTDKQLRVAFDGDSVIFSDESDIVTHQQGLDKFIEHERINEEEPLGEGPLKPFLEALCKLQQKFYAKDKRLDCPIRTYLVTARGGTTGGIRVLKTLRKWGLEIDSALFLAGADKGPVLQIIRPHIFFDDQMKHIDAAKNLGTIAAHVPYGFANK